ncbi:phytyl ester synthase 1, chloroplastic-like [Silene latifolia]|uniref:phytyl ester synthase 1, chloroplastic-like n=1 Tax=Silene latifolia TaxID=37657 RepID=UPI003D76BC4E
MASVLASWVSPSFLKHLGYKSGFRDGIKCNLSRVSLNDASIVKGNENNGCAIRGGKGDFGRIGGGGKRGRKLGPVDLEVFWDDGYGGVSMKDFLDISTEMIRPDGGPPRWFCPVECGRPLDDSPLLMYLPGMDGVGLGLIMHHKALGKVFEVRCLHIPVYDRTPFRGLVEFVEKAVREEHASYPDKPIYLVGDSFGGCLALAVAARCPTIDLVLILVNPATSVHRSPLKPFFPVLGALPDGLHRTLPYILSCTLGHPLKVAMVNVDTKLPPSSKLQHFAENLLCLLPRLSVVADVIPKDTLVWKLKLLISAADYTNPRLHAVKAEVLVLASGKDNMVPSENEAKRLSGLLKNCEFRIFKDSGHTLLMEEGVKILTIIKATNKYRRSRKIDFVNDFIPPSVQEYKVEFDQMTSPNLNCISPVYFSTLEDGKIVRGLTGVPNEGPVLLVGYHMLMGLELCGLHEVFLREKKIMLRGLAHPQLLSLRYTNEVSFIDYTRVFGATPVSAHNFFKLLSTKSHILLYPGGAREALHLKGEEYKLSWSDRQEFVRMAAAFGATIVPFGVVGEDDLVELVLDYDDYMKMPVVNYLLEQISCQVTKVRNGEEGDGGNENIYLPGVIPKLPGRFYYLFGKPIKTKGKPELVNDKESAKELYAKIQSEVKSGIAYLRQKREEDPYRNIIDRAIFRFISKDKLDIPTFSP